jgi:glycerol-3-phosphate acyltransferase PlsX
MKIIVDIMSGDKAPLEQLLGAYQAATEYPETEMVFVGNEAIIRALAAAKSLNLDLPNISLVNAEEVVTMEDAPLSVVREKKNSSMGIGLKMLTEGKGDAFVSAGNTGALHAGSTLIVRRIKGIQKSAIATILPYQNPMLLIDSGANIEINPETYVQFAKMGTVYMKQILGVENPRVGLLNIGAERQKGTKTVQEAYGLLEQAEGINFIGNVEGNGALSGEADVLVADGFAGNQVLKVTEGIARRIITDIVKMAKKSGEEKYMNIVGYLMSIYDFNSLGAGIILGVRKPVLKSHGAANETSISNAAKMLLNMAENKEIFDNSVRG